MPNISKDLHVERFHPTRQDFDGLLTRLRLKKRIGVWHGEKEGRLNVLTQQRRLGTK